MRLSIFAKIFIIFMAVVSPLYLVSIFISIDGQNRAKRDAYDSIINNVDFYVSTVEQTLHGIVLGEAALINNDDIKEISRLTEIPYDLDAYKKLGALLGELLHIKESNRFVMQTYILFPMAGLKLTERNIVPMSDFDRLCVTDSGFIDGFPFSNHDSGTYINITSEYHMVKPQAEKLSYIIVVQIDTGQIERDMRSFFAGPEDTLCFIGEDYGLTIHNTANEALLSEIAAFLSQNTATQGIETIYSEAMDAEMLVAYRSSRFLKTTFIITGEQKQFMSGLKNYRVWTWVLSAVMLLLLVVFTVWTRAVIAVPMNRLIGAIRRGIEGDIDNTIEYRANEEFTYLFRQFNDMLRLQRESMNEIYRRDLLLKDTELKMLQYQINPHFLYNCYFLMYQMMESENYETAGKMTRLMGDYFSFVTKSEEHIPLRQEMKFCDDYIGIQTIRFGGRIRTSIHWPPPEFRDTIVPRIVVQPILENCYRHGLANKESDGLIRLSFDETESAIVIEDNGEDLKDDKLAELRAMLEAENLPVMSGLWNVHKRLQSALGKEYGLRLSRGSLGGLRVEMRLPPAPKFEE